MNDPTARTLRLLSLLQTHKFWPGHELSDRLEVSARTLRRDIDRLRELGYAVDATPGVAGGYRLAAGPHMPPLVLDDDEAIALAVGLRAAAGAAIAGIEDTAIQALAKSNLTDALTSAVAFLEGKHGPARLAAAKAIGTLALDEAEARRIAASALAAAAPTSGDNELGHILTAICEIARVHAEFTPQAVALLETSMTQLGEHAIHQLSLELMLHGLLQGASAGG